MIRPNACDAVEIKHTGGENADVSAVAKRIEPLLDRYSWLLWFLLVAFASLRIVSTYSIFSPTSDEPAHVAAGMEWLDKKTYRYEAQHPPLARVMAALPLFLTGAHSTGAQGIYTEGWAILNNTKQDDRNLILARLGILPFFWLASLVIYLWTRRSCDRSTGLLATLLFTFVPAILAHAGLATTDMALTATLGGAFLTMLVWFERPTRPRSILFGAALAAAILSKFSALAFFPVACIFALATSYWTNRLSPGSVFETFRKRLKTLALVMIVCGFLIWAGYRFSFERYPAPEFVAGIHEVIEHNRTGQTAYLLGRFSSSGFWYYYPVALSFKTPLALSLLCVVGGICIWKRRRDAQLWIFVAFGAAILAVGLFSRINIGIRHVLPVYFSVCAIAAVGARHLASSASTAVRLSLAVLLVWLAASSIYAHPDYLAYFNELAGSHPEYIAVDSDLDWGQDAKRLGTRLRQLGATSVAVDPIIVANPESVRGYPALTPLRPDQPSPGWNAVSLTSLKLTRLGLYDRRPDIVPWPERTAGGERVGKGILLWYFPPDGREKR